MVVLRVEVAGRHQLERQLVGSRGYPESDAGFDIHDLAVVIHHCPHFVELVVQCFEVTQGPHVGVFLDGGGPLVVEVVGRAGRGNGFEVPKTARVVGIDNRIEDDVDGMQMHADDGPDFRR